jgi:imidazole glycerol-phosphate synthase subunit HisH
MGIVIIDYGVGNLESIRNMLKKAGFESHVSADRSVIDNADKLILPGVGAFDTCASKLRQSDLIDLLEKRVFQDQIPILGICVGLQLLMRGSEEGVEKGLGWVNGDVVRFKKEKLPVTLKIPHMGWADVQPAKSSPLLNGLHDSRFYFVHSYHVLLDEQSDALLTADYGYSFTAGIEKQNIMGVQFHPEKSHRYGLQLLTNFARNFNS